MIAVGWWTLNLDGVTDLTDEDREHIAQAIRDGFTEGQVVQELDDGADTPRRPVNWPDRIG